MVAHPVVSVDAIYAERGTVLPRDRVVGLAGLPPIGVARGGTGPDPLSLGGAVIVANPRCVTCTSSTYERGINVPRHLLRTHGGEVAAKRDAMSLGVWPR